jgi:hypothetical protein
MNLSIISATLTSLGEIVIAYTVVSVHHRMMEEHQIDDKVFKVMRKEQKIALVGVTLILAGYICHVANELI